MKAKLLLLALACLVPGLLMAQGGYKGSLTLEIVTEDNEPLPGGVATLTADTFTRSFTSDGKGLVRFSGLIPDTYTLRVTFAGFNTYVRPNIIIDTGANVRMDVQMTPSVQQEEMVVVATTPLLDKTKVGSATVLTEDELNSVPQARDPWAVLETVPGIQTDRINIGGSEAGQQSNFASKGDNGNNATWIMDGVEFVDPAASGSSQMYLDFSSFSQMSVTTGGADASVRSGGAALNFVTKQGSNNHQGSVRLVYADTEFQSSHDPIVDSRGNVLTGNQVNEIFEKSFEIGGPILKDRLWYWGSFNQNSINQLAITGQEDRTELRNLSFKIHGDITANTRFSLYHTEGDKIKNGRGAATTRPTNTTSNQDGPTPLTKFELSQLVGQNTELSLILARTEGGFNLTPVGQSGQISQDLSTGIWADTTWTTQNVDRPVDQFEVKGNTFISNSNMDHELQYSFQYKEATIQTNLTFGEDSLVSYHNGGVGAFAVLFREGNARSEIEYTSATIQDTISYGNWTFKGGLRYDSQEGRNLASVARASSFDPVALPELAYDGSATPFTWETIAPRLGATYAWGEDSQYLARVSVAQFYDTLTAGFITPENPMTFRYSFHNWNDDGDLIVQQGELTESLAGNANRSLNEIDPDLKAPKTDEIIAGFEWGITPEFTVGVTATLRERSDTTWLRLNGDIDPNAHYDLINATSTDPNTGEEVDVSYYAMNEAGAAALVGDNNILTNRPGYTEDYKGLELTATKRLSNRWMMRAAVTLQDWTRNVPDEAIQDPNNFQSGVNEDGGAIGVQSAGSGTRFNTFFGSANWTANLLGLYQLPWDVTISGKVNARQGFALPYGFNHNFIDAAGNRNNIFVKYDAFDASRAEDLYWADFKLTKTFNMGGRTRVELAAEVFNAFNNDALLSRNVQIGVVTANDPTEVMAPRLGRFSATVHF